VIYTTQRRRFVYDTWDNGSRLDRVMVECTLSITHCLRVRLNLQLHTIDLVRTCRISSFCTAVWQLARFQLTRRIARSLGDSWASCSACRFDRLRSMVYIFHTSRLDHCVHRKRWLSCINECIRLVQILAIQFFHYPLCSCNHNPVNLAYA